MKNKKIISFGIIGIIISISAFLVASILDHKRVEIIFEKNAAERIDLIFHSIEMTELVTESMRNYFISSDDISPTEFRNFINSYTKKIKGIQAIEWVPKVTYSKKDEYIKKAREQVSENFDIVELDTENNLIPVKKRNEYYPVYYVEPFEGNERALGFDLGSNPARLNALMTSVNENRMISSEKINLVQENEFGVLLFEPIFRKNLDYTDYKGRIKNLIGFAIGVINPKDIVEKSIGLLQPLGINITLKDESAPSDKSLLYSHKSRIEPASANTTSILDISHSKQIKLGQRIWSISCFPTEVFLSNHRSILPWLIFFICLAVTGVFLYFFYKHSLEKERINRLVEERTEELKESNERLDLALNGADLGVWDWQINSGEVYFNERWVSMLGYNKNEIEPNVDSWSKLLHPDDSEEVYKVLNQHLEGEIPIYSTEHRLLTKSGDWKWILDVGKVVEKDENNKPVRAIGIHMDISERQENQEKILSYNQKLEKVNKDKDRLFSIIGHDLKSPLISIKGFSEFLNNEIDELSNQEIKEYSAYIYQASLNLHSILEGLLEWGRLQMNKIQFEPKSYKLGNIAEKILSQYLLLTLTKKIKIKNRIRSNVFIYADENMVESIFRNLVSNAIKFTPTKGMITIDAKIEHDNRVIVSISDSGIGIDDKRMKTIFSDSIQVSTPGTEGEKGTGLGLSLTKDFVLKNGGEIWIEKNPKGGSIFNFTLCRDESSLVSIMSLESS